MKPPNYTPPTEREIRRNSERIQAQWAAYDRMMEEQRRKLPAFKNIRCNINRNNGARFT